MLNRLAKWVVVLMLVLATGGHWAFLQSVAWVSMAVQFSQSDSLPTALQKTLDGQHPCSLCKAIDEGLKDEKEQKMQKLETKLDFFCPGSQAFSLTQRVFELPFPASADPHSRADAPPVPPPRSA
jgi:hypothetical protein